MTDRRGRRWTAGELQRARAMARMGYTRADVADELGRTLKGVKAKLTGRRAGVAGFVRKAPDAELRAWVLALVAGGCRTAAEVAERTGRAVTTTRIMLQRLAKIGLVRRVGCDKYGWWEVTPKWGRCDSEPRGNARGLHRDA